MGGQGLDVVFAKLMSLQSELCGLAPPKDKLHCNKDMVYKVDCGG